MFDFSQIKLRSTILINGCKKSGKTTLTNYLLQTVYANSKVHYITTKTFIDPGLYGHTNMKLININNFALEELQLQYVSNDQENMNHLVIFDDHVLFTKKNHTNTKNNTLLQNLLIDSHLYNLSVIVHQQYPSIDTPAIIHLFDTVFSLSNSFFDNITLVNSVHKKLYNYFKDIFNNFYSFELTINHYCSHEYSFLVRCGNEIYHGNLNDCNYINICKDHEVHDEILKNLELIDKKYEI
jgi:GTPase SAR1 family protein